VKAQCQQCGRADAVCVGRYDAEHMAFACDGCCAHGNEDGFCVMLQTSDNAQLEGELDIAHGVIADLENENDLLTARVAALESQLEIAEADTPSGGSLVH